MIKFLMYIQNINLLLLYFFSLAVWRVKSNHKTRCLAEARLRQQGLSLSLDRDVPSTRRSPIVGDFGRRNFNSNFPKKVPKITSLTTHTTWLG